MIAIKFYTAPLSTGWQEQYIALQVDGLTPGTPASLTIDGQSAPFQYLSDSLAASSHCARVMLRLGFEKGQKRTLEFQAADKCDTNLEAEVLSFEGDTAIGTPGHEIHLTAPVQCDVGFTGPFSGFAGHPLRSVIHTAQALESCRLTCDSSGPLFADYTLNYQFSSGHFYLLRMRCYQHSPYMEISEEFQLGQNSGVTINFNPEFGFDHVLTHPPFDFEGDGQPVSEPLQKERPRDLLCRLQMPSLGEYAVPGNRGWFAFYNSTQEERGMLGVMGLYGSRWTQAVANMPVVKAHEGAVVWKASLASGKRFWMFYAGPLQKEFTPGCRFIFHRLHAEYNALRLDEHLDLDGEQMFDAIGWNQPAFFGEDYRERARTNADALTPLKKTADAGGNALLEALINPQKDTHRKLLDGMLAQFEKWVRDFQGYRSNESDYNKNVIGFSRTLRRLMLHYELLRKDGFLSEDEIKKLNGYFIFAARRIMDEGRWPHSRTWLHPDHPESVRDLYSYPGEHRPDKLVWSNSLPNFQSDPLCALLQLSALFADHPESAVWRRMALDDLERNLNAYLGKSGAWEESINYALYTFWYFFVTFRVLKYRLGIDYFGDERMRCYVAWLVRFLGPYDKRFGVHTFPGIGNVCIPISDRGSLLAYAGEIAPGDPLHKDLVAAYQTMEHSYQPHEELSCGLLATANLVPQGSYARRPLTSEHMDELGVAMRHDHPTRSESFLFQKIGFWKDHYENDETSINWYAKGTPLVMDYGTYTPDTAEAKHHNLVEVPDMDSLRRGYLAAHYFSPQVDYTRCEMPVGLKLLHGRMRTFKEINGPPQPPLFFYIGDDNPVGPKVWKTRVLLFIKPDYVALFDRVQGPVQHRYNLHVTADEIRRDGQHIKARGRFDLDLHCLVQHPAEFNFEEGELQPAPERFGEGEANAHRQKYFRVYNTSGNTYRTLLFAGEKDRQVALVPAGSCGIKIITPEYIDFVFINDGDVFEDFRDADGGQVCFSGRCGWIRHASSGVVSACLTDGDIVEAFGVRIEGRGPWHYGGPRTEGVVVGGVPRKVTVSGTQQAG